VEKSFPVYWNDEKYKSKRTGRVVPQKEYLPLRHEDTKIFYKKFFFVSLCFLAFFFKLSVMNELERFQKENQCGKMNFNET
jgi:hypothetical protein